MNLARISANGQITVPVEIRRKLNLRAGDKHFFDAGLDQPRVMTSAEYCSAMNLS